MNFGELLWWGLTTFLPVVIGCTVFCLALISMVVSGDSLASGTGSLIVMFLCILVPYAIDVGLGGENILFGIPFLFLIGFIFHFALKLDDVDDDACGCLCAMVSLLGFPALLFSFIGVFWALG